MTPRCRCSMMRRSFHKTKVISEALNTHETMNVAKPYRRFLGIDPRSGLLSLKDRIQCVINCHNAIVTITSHDWTSAINLHTTGRCGFLSQRFEHMIVICIRHLLTSIPRISHMCEQKTTMKKTVNRQCKNNATIRKKEEIADPVNQGRGLT